MNRILCILAVVSLFFGCRSTQMNLTGSKSTPVQPIENKTSVESLSQMTSLSKILEEIIPTYSTQWKATPQNNQRLKKSLVKLKTLSVHVNKGLGAAGPLFESASRYLKQESDLALSYLDNN